MTDSFTQDWITVQTPDAKVELRCPSAWKRIEPISEDVCLALAAPEGLPLVELLVAEAPAESALQPSDLKSLAQIATVTIEGLREIHPDLSVLAPVTGISDWREGVCAHYIVKYQDGSVGGNRLDTVTDAFLIGKGAKFAHLNIKCAAHQFRAMTGIDAEIAKSVSFSANQTQHSGASESPSKATTSIAGATASDGDHPRQPAPDLQSLQALAERGDSTAQYNLGVFYHLELGDRADFAQAAHWYEKAAKRGLAQAQVNLGMLYSDGLGVPQDYRKAMRWFARAADQGFADGEFKLGIMYANGWGVRQDYQLAFNWVHSAAQKGHADAQNLLPTITKRGVMQGIRRSW